MTFEKIELPPLSFNSGSEQLHHTGSVILLGQIFCLIQGFEKIAVAHRGRYQFVRFFLSKPERRRSRYTYLHLTAGLDLLARRLSRVLPMHCYFQDMGVLFSKVSQIVANRSPQFDSLTGGIDNHLQFQLQHQHLGWHLQWYCCLVLPLNMSDLKSATSPEGMREMIRESSFRE